MKESYAKAKEWWHNLAPRERLAVSIGGSLLGVFILYAGIFTPYLNAVDNMRNRIASDAKLLAWMQVANTEIQKYTKQNAPKSTNASPVSLLSFLQKKVSSSGMDQQLKLLKQSSNDSIELQLQKVEFDKFMSLLISVCKEQPVAINQMSVNNTNVSGVVNATVMLKLA